MGKRMLISIVLDETGSMLYKKDITLSGLNEYIGTVRNKKPKARLTVIAFNSSDTRTMIDDVKLKNVPEITGADYHPRDTTPLYDAVGAAIVAIDKSLEKKSGNVLFIIVTDGLENASMEYTRDDVFGMIKKRKKDGWTFAFLGADQDAFAASAKFGISHGSTISHAGVKTAETMYAAAVATVQHIDYMTTTGDTSSRGDLFEDTDKEKLK